MMYGKTLKVTRRLVSTRTFPHVGQSQDVRHTISTYSQKSPVFNTSSLQIDEIVKKAEVTLYGGLLEQAEFSRIFPKKDA